METLLITGATGFLGQHCLARLAASGAEVHAVARGEPDGCRNGIHWHCADLLDATAPRALMERIRPGKLLHLAWGAASSRDMNSPDHLRWAQGGIELLRWFHRTGGERAVFAGSCAEYDWRYGYCSERHTPLAPATLYGASKHALQTVTESFCREVGLSHAWARIFFVYGPYEAPDRLVPAAIRAFLRGEVGRFSEGKQFRDYLHADDVARALLQLLDSELEGPVNVGSGIPVRVRDLVEKIADKLGGRHLSHFGARQGSGDEAPLVAADVGRLERELGWSPEWDLENGLDQTIGWWRKRMGESRCPEASETPEPIATGGEETQIS